MDEGGIKRQAKRENAYGDKVFWSKDQHCSQAGMTAKYLESSSGCFLDNKAKRLGLLVTPRESSRIWMSFVDLEKNNSKKATKLVFKDANAFGCLTTFPCMA